MQDCESGAQSHLSRRVAGPAVLFGLADNFMSEFGEALQKECGKKDGYHGTAEFEARIKRPSGEQQIEASLIAFQTKPETCESIQNEIVSSLPREIHLGMLMLIQLLTYRPCT